MSKKKHRDKKKINDNQFNINPQLLNLLRGSNIDMNKVSGILSAMNQDGFDINALSSMLQNNAIGNMNLGNFDLNAINNNLGNMDKNNMPIDGVSFNNSYANNNTVNNACSNNTKNINYDENIEMLLIVKSVVNPNKARFLDKVIEMYKDGEIQY